MKLEVSGRVSMDTSVPATRRPNEGMEEEYTVHVPLVRVKQKFREVLVLAGARGEIFTKKEICHYLKDYISSRQLYDVNDPRIVHCGHDLLGKVFGVEQFTIDQALDLLASNVEELPDRCIRRKRRVVAQPVSSQLPQNPSSASVTIAVCHNTSQCTGPSITATSTQWKPPRKNLASSSSDSAGKHAASCHADCDVTSSTQSRSSTLVEKNSEGTKKGKRKKHTKESSGAEPSPRKRHHTEPCSSAGTDGSSRRRGTSLSITYGAEEGDEGFPWYFQVEVSDEESEVLSVQDKETVTVRDSSDDLWFVEENAEPEVEFSVEYDVQSDSPEPTESDLSSIQSREGLLVVCRESDVEFFADYSDSDSNTDDRELTDADNWVCQECELSNPPYQRFCDRCWKMRADWLPPRDTTFDSANEKGADMKSKTEGTLVKVNDTLDSGFGSLSSTQPSSQETIPSETMPSRLKSLGLPSLSDLSKSQESLIESSSEQRYSFSSFQLSEKQTSTTGGEDKPDPFQTVKLTNSALDEPCIICLTKAKSASLIHGSSGHQVCCFSCAKRLKRRGKVCPVCRRPIQKVVKNYIL